MTKTWGFWPKTSTFRGPNDSGKVVLHLDKFSRNTNPSQVNKVFQRSVTSQQTSVSVHWCCIFWHTLKIQVVRIQDCKSRLPFGEWGFRVVLVLEWKSLQNSTEGTRLCRRLSVFCCNRQLALDYSHTAKDKLPLLQTSGHFRRLYSHFLPLLTQYKTVFFPRSPPFATHTKQSAPCPITYFITSTAADLQGGKL